MKTKNSTPVENIRWPLGRKTLEAYTASTPIEGEDEASACGVGYSKDKEWNLIVKVTTGNIVKMIKIDRFD